MSASPCGLAKFWASSDPTVQARRRCSNASRVFCRRMVARSFSMIDRSASPSARRSCSTCPTQSRPGPRSRCVGPWSSCWDSSTAAQRLETILCGVSISSPFWMRVSGKRRTPPSRTAMPPARMIFISLARRSVGRAFLISGSERSFSRVTACPLQVMSLATVMTSPSAR